MDTSVGFSQSLDDLQSVEQLVRTFDPQQLLPAKTLAILHTKKIQSFTLCLKKKTPVVNGKATNELFEIFPQLCSSKNKMLFVTFVCE